MAYLQSLSYGAEKTPVVVDLGSAYTKIGFAGEVAPRAIIRSEITDRKSGKVCRFFECELNRTNLQTALNDFFFTIYHKHLLVNPKERRVVVVESLLSRSDVRDAVASVLFQHYEVLSLLFVPLPLVSLMPLGLSTGLVLDVGYLQATVFPVFESSVIMKGCDMLPLGGKAVHRNLESQLLELSSVTTCQKSEQVKLSSVFEKLDENTLEDITVRCCFVTSLDRTRLHQAASTDSSVTAPEPPPAVDYPFIGNAILHVDGTVREQACEVFFKEDADEQTLATLILDSLLECNVDVRKSLAENLVIVGGCVSLRGFMHRLLAELRHFATNKPKYQNIMKDWSFKVHKLPSNPNCQAWLGGAMFSGLEVLPFRSLSRENYKENMSIPDWCSLAEVEEEKPTPVEKTLQNLAQAT